MDVSGIIKGNAGYSGDVSGNSKTATQLQNSVKIGGVSFDGSSDINLPGMNVAGDLSGNAATADVATFALGVSGENVNGYVANATNATNATNGAFCFKENISGEKRIIKLDNGTLKFEKEPNKFEAFGSSNIDDIKKAVLTLRGPSAPIDISANGQENSDYANNMLTVTWTNPTLSNQLSDTLATTDNILEYIVELSKDSLFNTIDISQSGITIMRHEFDRISTNELLRCTGYYVRVAAKNSMNRLGEYAVLKKNGIPLMVSSGNNCYEYVNEASWIELPDYYKKDIKTIVFKEPLISSYVLTGNALDGVQPEKDFTIIIEPSVEDISSSAFEGLVNLKKVVIKESTSTLRLGNYAFLDCYQLSTVEIHRTLVWSPSNEWFNIKTSPTNIGISSVNVTFSTTSGATTIEHLTDLDTGQNRNQASGVIVTLDKNDTVINLQDLTNGTWINDDTVKLQWNTSLVGDMGTPAINGKQIRDAGRPTGWYWIKTSSMDSEKLVFINNDDEGGGWMLITYDYDVNKPRVDGILYPDDFVPSVNSNLNEWSNKVISCDVYKLWYHDGIANVNENLHMWDNNAGRNPILSDLTSEGTASRVVWDNPGDFKEANIENDSARSVDQSPPLDGKWYNVKDRENIGDNLQVKAPCDWLLSTGDKFMWSCCNSSESYDTDASGRSANGKGTFMLMQQRDTLFYGGLNVAPGTDVTNTNCSTFAIYIR